MNNIIKMTWDNTWDNEQDVSNISYQYNSANYPTKMNVTDSDEFSDSLDIEYILK